MYVLCIMERDRCYTCIIMCPRHTLTIRFSPDFTRLFWTALVGYSGSCSLHISQQLYAPENMETDQNWAHNSHQLPLMVRTICCN